MGTGRSTADNFAQGGIASAIDFETGTLGVARSLDKHNFTPEHEIHPDTGARITGRQVPFWHQAINLAIDAHHKLGEMPCVGGDVAVLEDGPVMVEGNWDPCVKLLQLATGTPLLITEFARAYAAWLDDPECSFDDNWLLEQRGWRPLKDQAGDV